KGVGIAYKKGVMVVRRNPGGNFHPADHKQILPPGSLLRQLIGFIVVLPDLIRKAFVINMLGDGNHIQPVPDRLVYPESRPDMAIRKDGVHMKITLECPITRDIGDVYFSRLGLSLGNILSKP